MKQYRDKIPLVLAIVLYILIYFVRFQQAVPAGPLRHEASRQGGWDPQLDIFPEFREKLDKKIALYLSSPQAQLLSGIVLGEKKNLPYDLRLALRDTSTLHMIVVSGQNLSLLAALVLRLSGILGKRWAIFLSLVVISGYVIITGGQIPVLRAALMAFLSNLAALLGRQNDGFWTLLLVAALLLLINPVWIADLSFQLSFLATFGVVVIAPILGLSLAKLPIFLRENLSLTLGAQMAVFPVIAQNFHQLSLVSIPANLLTLWTIPYLMGGGLMMLVLVNISGFATQVMALGLGVLLTYFTYIVKFFASMPFAWEYVGQQVWVVWVGYYLVLAGILMVLARSNRHLW